MWAAAATEMPLASCLLALCLLPLDLLGSVKVLPLQQAGPAARESQGGAMGRPCYQQLLLQQRECRCNSEARNSGDQTGWKSQYLGPPS